MIPVGSGATRKAREQVRSHISAGQTEGADDRNFVNAETVTHVGKAREQVGAHNIADQGSFVDANKSIPTPKGDGARLVPDVHLTRFAAYFVALNADQSKPESTAHDTPMRGCMIQRPNAVECNDVRGATCEHPGKKDVSAGHSVSPCNTFPSIVRGCDGFPGSTRGCNTFRGIAKGCHSLWA